MKKGYEVAADPTEWDADQQEIRQAKEDALNQVDELDDEDEDADASAGKRKKSGKDKSKKKAKTAKVSRFSDGFGRVANEELFELPGGMRGEEKE